MLDFTRTKKTKKQERTDIGINIGDTLQLNIEQEKKHKYYSHLIGYLPNKSLLVTCPRHEGKMVPLKTGQALNVRMLSDSSVLGFKTKIITVIQQPYPYVHLEYPFTTGRIIMRKAQRVTTKLIVLVQPESLEGPVVKPVSAATTNVSTCGALLESPQELGRPGDFLTLRMRLNIGGAGEYLTIPAVIRHVHIGKHPQSKRRMFFHGVEFRILEQHDSIVLHGFIYQQMAHQAI